MNHKKEILLAVFLGALFGFCVAVFIWKSPIFVNPASSPEPTRQAAMPTPAFSLTLTSPEDELLTNEGTTTVSGKIQGASLIIISGNLEDKVIEASPDSFETKIVLEEGPNEIQVTCLGPYGEEVSSLRTVNYSKEEL